jgi:hypothetical protein
LGIEDGLFAFIRTSIRSIWNVELLLCLGRSPERWWSPDDLVRELRASQSIVAEGLGVLETAGLATSDARGFYRYAPATKEFDRLTQELARLHDERPLTVTEVMFSSDDKLRKFADAFRLTKE